MLIHFRNHKLEKVFTSEKELVRTYGVEQGRLLMRRVTELRAAGCLNDLRQFPALRAHELTGDRKGQISITVRHPHRLIVITANVPEPRLPDGGLDWAAVTEITILESSITTNTLSQSYAHNLPTRLRHTAGRHTR